jgi:serine/threonine protein kinase
MPDSWRDLERIFSTARTLPEASRAAFVVSQCGGDRMLETEALALLRADERSGDFMERPALERLASVWPRAGSSLAPGERVGAYTIIDLLGAGGAGEVWRGRDERLHRDVAIKVLLPHWSADAERLRRFAEEARTAGSLNHSNILTVYDVGEHAGVPFLVSECLEGQSLRARLEARPIAAGEAVRIALGVAAALTAAHERGIVHLDLKPENLFLLRSGDVKVLDFGLAKLARSEGGVDDPAAATPSALVGTVAYMAPE